MSGGNISSTNFSKRLISMSMCAQVLNPDSKEKPLEFNEGDSLVVISENE